MKAIYQIKNTLLLVYLLIFGYCSLYSQTSSKIQKDLSTIEVPSELFKNKDSVNYYFQEIINNPKPCEGLEDLLTQYYKNNSIRNCEDFNESKTSILQFKKMLYRSKNSISDSCYAEIVLGIHKMERSLFWEYCPANYTERIRFINQRKELLDSIKSINVFNPERLRFEYTYNKHSRGIANRDIENYEKGASILKECLVEYESLLSLGEDQRKLYQTMYYNAITALGNLNLKRGIIENKKYLDSAEKYYQKAYDLPRENWDTYLPTKILRQYNLGRIAFYKEKYSNALNHFHEGLKIDTSKNYHRRLSLFLGDCYYKLDEPDSSLTYLKKFKTYDFSGIPNFQEAIIRGNHLTAQNYLKLKLIDSAAKYADITVNEISKYEKGKRKASDFILKSELETMKKSNLDILDSKTQQKRIYLGTIGIIFAIALTIIIYLQKRNRDRQKKYQELLTRIKTDNIKVITTNNKKELKIEDELTQRILKDLATLIKNEIFLRKDFSLHTLAQKLNTNTSYLSQIINEYKGQSFKEYTQELRIQFITKQLHENRKYRKYSIRSLADEVGYSEAAFSSIFKKINGISPSYYIKELEKDAAQMKSA